MSRSTTFESPTAFPPCPQYVSKISDIVNRHYEKLLAEAGLSSTRARAETTRRASSKELVDLVAKKEKMLQEAEDYAELLEKMNMAQGSHGVDDSSTSELDGEWRFLYMDDGRIFGFLRLEATECDGSVGSFGLPRAVLAEARSVLQEEPRSGRPVTGSLHQEAKCPACEGFFPLRDFWLHAMEELCYRNVRVPAHRVEEPGRSHRWVVPCTSGWPVPIYRVQCLDHTQEITESLCSLNLKNKQGTHQDFCDSLDRASQLLSKIIKILSC